MERIGETRNWRRKPTGDPPYLAAKMVQKAGPPLSWLTLLPFIISERRDLSAAYEVTDIPIIATIATVIFHMVLLSLLLIKGGPSRAKKWIGVIPYGISSLVPLARFPLLNESIPDTNIVSSIST